jgi:hypothetical protein
VPNFLEQDLDLVNPVLNRCEAFFKDSTQQLKKAVAESGNPRVVFVPSGFTDDNSVFVRATSLLWGLDLDDDLSPEDPVAAARRPLCQAAHSDPLQLLERELCFRASAGHPNVEGAVHYSTQILAVLP